MENTGSAAMAELQVRATTMSGRQVDLLLGAEEPITLLRQKVGEALGIRKWQLRLIHGGMVVNNRGLIKELVGAEAETVELIALAVEATDVKKCSKDMSLNFKGDLWFSFDMLSRDSQQALLYGELDFHYDGDNMLELLLKNPHSFVIQSFMSLLLRGGACVNSPSNDGYTPLLTACRRGLSKQIKHLLQLGANPQQQLPNGDDALVSALNFFHACSKVNDVNARPLQEDLDLGRTCCIFRATNIQSATGLLPLEEARLKLSQAAIELALLARAGASLCQKRILEKSGMDPALTEAFGEDLWAGWPTAFFTFSGQIPKVGHAWDKDFLAARHKILRYDQRCFDEERVYTQDCWCPLCCPSLNDSPLETDSFVTCYQLRKGQNKKWEASKGNVRRSRLARFASSSGGVSRSSRMARKLPPSYRGFQVKNILQGQQQLPSKQPKLQVLKQLAFDCYGLDRLCRYR